LLAGLPRGTAVGAGPRLSVSAPDLNPVEGIWPLLERSVANLAAEQADLVGIIKRKLKKIQDRTT
jgi:hypothetical protein